MKKNIEIWRLVELATKAPSGHNTQPWIFYTSENQIDIHPDFTRALPVVDEDNHALYISLGCAAENILVAARSFGYDCKICLSGSSSEAPYITVKIFPDEMVERDGLVDFIETRQSTRTAYRREGIAAEELEQLKNSFNFNCVIVKLFSTPDEIKKIEPFIIEVSNMQFQNKKFINELVSWFRFSEREAKEKADGLWTASMGLPKMNRFIGNIVMKYFVSPKSEAKRWKKLIHSSAGFAMFIAKENTIENWVMLGRAFQRFGLTATKLNISHAHANMPCEELTVRKKMADRLNIGTSHPLLLVRFGYADKMPYSFRRGLEKVLGINNRTSPEVAAQPGLQRNLRH
jgi:hypothetical protein